MTHKPLITTLATAFIASTPMLVHAENRNAKSDDQQITDQVKQKLAMDDPGIGPHILVTTRDGVVTLMGMDVPKDKILTAVHDAKSVDGVVRVDNRLKPE
jgi:osmotically-inducible protein OsmY